MKFLARAFATGFFIGHMPFAGGTWASLIGCAAWVLLSKGPFYHLAAAAVILLGFPLAGYAERRLYDGRDPSQVVIDEIAGMLITYASFTFTADPRGVLFLIAGFLLFRLFDILKPFPANALQSLRGGAGIMMDDVAAGIYANAALQILRLLLGMRNGGGGTL
jgi:phosphatidylglycerophosphatase A